MNDTILLPAIRSYVGDWTFYVTTLSFNEVMRLVKEPDEIHERRLLSEWIQREAIDSHSEAISNYIIENEQRFLGSLIIGVYGGTPHWAPLCVSFSADPLELTDDEKCSIAGKLGLLHLSGNEKLFAIDGQHRVAGIKKAIGRDDIDLDIKKDNISAIFVAHDDSSIEGKQRTRRLFTTVNKKAKRIGKAGIIALDEDNGFAVVTRRLIDRHWLFEDKRNHISYTSTGSIPANDETLITSVVGLAEIVKDLFPRTGRKKFESERPEDERLDEHLNFCVSYVDTLLDQVDEYKKVFISHTKKASDYRVDDKNNLLFRPAGQRTFARAVQLLISRGENIEQSVDALLKVNMYIDSVDWHHILWDPIDNKMIYNKLLIAETRLLILAGKQPRNEQNRSKLEALLASLSR